MASIIKRKKSYSVVYNYTDENGETKQKWETWHTHKEALRRKAEVENQQNNGTFIPPNCQKVSEFLYDFDLVIALPNGRPCEERIINKEFALLKEKAELPNVVFHSLRHSSTTYKLKLNHGDLKATQGDTGHAEIDMITKVYAHILDEDRKINAQKFESAFYTNANPDLRHVAAPPEPQSVQTVDLAALIEQLQQNPELANTLAALIAGSKGSN